MSKINEPHGVLIDRDALIAGKIQKMMDSNDPQIRMTGECFKIMLLEEPEVVGYEDCFDMRDLCVGR